MILTQRPLIGFCAHSGTGKTTLIAQLISLLKEQGLRVAVIKHGHHTVELDTQGKDTYRFREAGAEQVIFASNKQMAVMQANHEQVEEVSLQQALQLIQMQAADLVLVEGFKHEAFPKIELHRQALGNDFLYHSDPNTIAIASDNKDTQHPIPTLDINQPEQIVQFILDEVMTGKVHQTHVPQNTIRTALSCADDYDPDSLTLATARERILSLVKPLNGSIKVALRDALGKILAEDVTSPINVPSHTNSAMDGYAVRGCDLPEQSIESFKVIGSALAGVPFKETCGQGECVRIMTGAPMPEGTDTVIMQEHVEQQDDQARIGSGHKTGQNVRQAGEDIKAEHAVLKQGHRIHAADLGLLASLGIGEIHIKRAPRVAFFSTGDELRSIGETLDEGCVYDSNRYTLFGMLTELGMDVLDMGVVRDNPEALELAFEQASQHADVIITSGGVSVGEADFTKQILNKLGQINFWKIAMKPGRPLAYGKVNEAVFFGLPGNPVAVMVTFQQLVKAALLKLAGESDYEPLIVQAVLTEKLRKKVGRAEFPRGILSRRADGVLEVRKTGMQGSGILTSMSVANCFMLLSEDCGSLPAGSIIEVQPFNHC